MTSLKKNYSDELNRSTVVVCLFFLDCGLIDHVIMNNMSKKKSESATMQVSQLHCEHAVYLPAVINVVTTIL